jgi:hypothetical protein
MLAEKGPKARRVQRGAGADDLRALASGELLADIGQNVDRIGGDDQDRPGGMPVELADDVPENGGVAVEHLQTRLTRFLRHAGADHDQLDLFQAFIRAGPHNDGLAKGLAVHEVHGFAFGLIAVLVDKDDLAAQAAQKSA